MLEAHQHPCTHNLHGVLVAAKGLGDRVVVPDEFDPFLGTIHGEPTMNRDGIRSARKFLALTLARREGASGLQAAYLLEHCVPEEFAIVLADSATWLTLVGQDCGRRPDLRLALAGGGRGPVDGPGEGLTLRPGFVDPQERVGRLKIFLFGGRGRGLGAPARWRRKGPRWERGSRRAGLEPASRGDEDGGAAATPGRARAEEHYSPPRCWRRASSASRPGERGRRKRRSPRSGASARSRWATGCASAGRRARRGSSG